MAEIAGLVLGVAGIIVPAYQGLEAFHRRVRDSRQLSKTLKSLELSLFIQKALLRNETQILFESNGNLNLNKETIHEMLLSREHGKWHDPDFQTEFAEFLGEGSQNLTKPFEIIGKTLEKMETELDKVIQASRAESNLGQTGPVNRSDWFMVLLRRTKRRTQEYRAQPKIQRLDQLLDDLRSSISDLFQLRRQREKLAGYRAMQRPDPFAAVAEIQKSSSRVYEAMAAVAECTCHRYYFQLRSEVHDGTLSPFGLSSSSDPVFFLLLLEKSDKLEQLNQICTCVVIRQELHSTRSSSLKQTAAQHKPTIRKPLAAYTSDITVAAAQCSASRAPRLAVQLGGPAASDDTTTTDKCITIESLCASIRTTCTVTDQSLYIGSLVHETHQHSLYREPIKSTVSQISLPEIFAQARKFSSTSILPRAKRYRLAFVLAYSLLHFGATATSWFRKNWRSEDVLFLQEQSTSEDGGFSDFPLIAVNFHASDDLDRQSTIRTCLAQDEQLLSLAITLVEIGYGQPLLARKPTDEAKWNWDHVEEYLEAKRLSEQLSTEMGTKYANAVRRCFSCNFGLDVYDFSKQDLQKAFYEKVVCELRECCLEFPEGEGV